MSRSLRDRGAMKAKASSQQAQRMKNAFENGVLLAHTYEKEKPPPNPKGWWVSEKLDGVRAYWNGEDFYSRSGQRFHAPGFFKEGLPADDHLDGELWLAREQFESCVGIVRTTDPKRAEEWRKLKFLMFDAPIIGGEVDLEYETRQAYCEKVESAAPFASAVPIRKCEGKAHMETLLKGVLANGGEGLMLRAPRSVYERTRSHSLLKVKIFLDAEARVIGHSADSKLAGAMGALECEMPGTGVTFKVGSGLAMAERATMAEGRRLFPKGTVITYKYQGLTAANGKPRFPTYLRTRSDKTWDEVVADAAMDAERMAAEAGMPPLARAPSLMAAPPEVGGSAAEPSAEAAGVTVATSSAGKRKHEDILGGE